MTHFQPSAFTRTNEQGIERLRRPDGRRFAFIVPHPIGEYVAASQEPCDVIAVGRFLAHGGYALAVPRPSTAVSRGALDAALQRLSDIGFLDQLYHKWWMENARCAGGSEASGRRAGSRTAAAMRRGDDIRNGSGSSGIKLRAVDRMPLLDSTASKAWLKKYQHEQFYWLLFVVVVRCAILSFT